MGEVMGAGACMRAWATLLRQGAASLVVDSAHDGRGCIVPPVSSLPDAWGWRWGWGVGVRVEVEVWRENG